jgi:hypothetical protein
MTAFTEKRWGSAGLHTRKSTDGGLEQSFTPLDAVRGLPLWKHHAAAQHLNWRLLDSEIDRTRYSSGLLIGEAHKT